MVEFVTGEKLEDKITDIIWNAKKILIIVSPFIKLDDYFKKLFEKHKNNPELKIIIVFGKNETNLRKSLSKVDFDFFRTFLNISIVYCPNLHAKYYANEEDGIITSINLYDKSFEKNIEYGVFFKSNFYSSNSIDNAAWETSFDIANKQSDAIFIVRPCFKNGFIFNSYIRSQILYDATDIISINIKWNKESKRKLSEFPDSISAINEEDKPVRNESKPERKETKQSKRKGYCIRTGVPIDYNPMKPLSLDAYLVWSQFQDWDFPEQYCHASGKKSLGKTSMRNPILFDEFHYFEP